jgi:energy-coupling factor transport system permease protein
MTYERRASPLHAARAVVAAAWSLALVTAAVVFDHPLVLATLLAIALAGAAAAHVGRRVVAILRFALPFALLIALVNALVVRDGLTVIWRFGEVPVFGRLDVTLEALTYGGLLGLRAIVILVATAVLSATVDPDELLGVFRRVSFRSALTAALAVRLVPVLQRDGRRLAEARRCRAEQPGRVAVLRAVAAGALDRAADVAATLEVRGYRAPAARHPAALRRPWSRHDVAFGASAAGLLALTFGAVALRLAGVEPYPGLEVELGRGELVLCAGLAVVALLPFADRRGIEP